MTSERSAAERTGTEPPLGLTPHADLKRRRRGDVLVLPERALRLAGSGGEILRLFDRPRTPSGVVAILRDRYPASESLESDVRAFLFEMQRLGALAPTRPEGADATGSPRRAEPDEVRRTPSPASARAIDEAPSAASPDAAPRAVLDDSPGPLNLIAELTYRCPLQCPYCSNPLDFRDRRERLDAGQWGETFEAAAELGVVHLGLTGGEPSTRTDLEEILSRAVRADLYPHLVTAGRPLTPERLEDLAARGLRSVQVSLQAVDAALSDRIAGTPSFTEKLAICRRTVELGLALTLNCVLHRQNLDGVDRLIELAMELGASRLELANTQYHGWALRNRAALMPTREQLDRASAVVDAARARATSRGLTLLYVLPDYHSGRPKPCMGGWGRLAMVVDPTGLVLPCHEAADLPGLAFWRVPERSLADAWLEAPGMQAFRGTDWMGEPCRSCPARELDFGGCRCQAFRLLNDPAKTDPTCSRSPDHALVVAAREVHEDAFVHRR